MTKILDRGCESDIAALVVQTLLDEGYPPNQIIPGLVSAIHELAEVEGSTQQVLDEVVVLLEEEDDSYDPDEV